MLLAIDTSTQVIGVALYDGAQVISERIWLSQDYHSVELAPAVQDVLARSDIKVSQLEGVAVALGPGSFTGLRIGLALAKGMALASHIALLGVPSLDILAVAQPLMDVPMAAVLRAGRNRLAVGWYRVKSNAWKPNGPLEMLSGEALAEKIQETTLVCGELSEEDRYILRRRRRDVILASPARSLRRPSYLAELAWRRLNAGKVDDPATLAPIYLHTTNVIPA
jgi:tRNA threonylcarbamoyladenosine biosynthesis protein TsaB